MIMLLHDDTSFIHETHAVNTIVTLHSNPPCCGEIQMPHPNSLFWQEVWFEAFISTNVPALTPIVKSVMCKPVNFIILV